MDECRDLLELFGVPDVFASGLGAVEDIGGGCWRFTFYAKQDSHGHQERVVVAKLIMSKEALPAAIHMAAKTTNTCACHSALAMTRN